MPRKVEKDHVFGVVLDHVRDIRRTHKGESKLVLRVAGLRLLFPLIGNGVAFNALFPPVQKKAPWG